MSSAVPQAMLKRLRAAAVSVLATLLDVTTLLLLVRVAHLTAGVAAAIGCLLGGVVNFALARRWVFAARGGSPTRQLALYGVLVVAGSAVLCGGLVGFATATLGAPVVVAKGAAAALVFLGWTYPISARVVFATTASS